MSPRNLIVLKGDLGNQLFQYSFFHLLKRNNLPVHRFYADYHRDTYGRTQEINKFADDVDIFNRPADGSKIFNSENFDSIRTELPLNNGNIVIKGYFQNYDYVKSSKIESIVKTPLVTQECTALHIRRSDYAHNRVLPIKYYLEALKLNQPKFVIFTDEPNFALFYFIKVSGLINIFPLNANNAFGDSLRVCSHRSIVMPILATHGLPHTWHTLNVGRTLLHPVGGRLTALVQDIPLNGRSLRQAWSIRNLKF